MNKSDLKLGVQIKRHLNKNKVETPMILNQLDQKDKAKMLTEHYKTIVKVIGLDREDDSIKETPRRIGDMYAHELFSGMNYENFPKCTTVENKFEYDEMVTIKDIPVMSLCEHHFQPIDGVCKISYIPDKSVLGLSKFNRVVDFFSRRPQIQERLTEQIYYALNYILGTRNIAVEIVAVHYCVKARGVKHENCVTKTTKLGGVFKQDKERNEFIKA